jgi:hypothetical protein
MAQKKPAGLKRSTNRTKVAAAITAAIMIPTGIIDTSIENIESTTLAEIRSVKQVALEQLIIKAKGIGATTIVINHENGTIGFTKPVTRGAGLRQTTKELLEVKYTADNRHVLTKIATVLGTPSHTGFAGDHYPII